MLLERLVVKLEADIASFKSNLTAADRAMDQFGGRMQSVGAGMSAAITLPLVALGGAATKMAADAEEAASKFDAVFGSAAGRVRTQLEGLRETIPEARSELVGMAAEIQDLLVPLGFANEEAAGMSVGVLKLAADLASFNNLRVSDVLADIRSGFVGQSEPLLKYGAITNAAAVQTKALELGLIAEGEALTSTARAQAVLAIITESNAAALGDAAKTADSSANSMKFLARDVKDLAVTFGNILLPIITPIVQNLSSFVTTISELPQPVQEGIVVIAGLAAATGPLLFAVGTLIKLLPVLKIGFAAMTGPIGLTVAAITAAAAVWMIWGDDIKRIVSETVSAVREWFSTRLTAIFDGVQRKIEAVTGGFRKMYDLVVGNSYVPDMVDGIAAEFARFDNVMVRPTAVAVERVEGLMEGMMRRHEERLDAMRDRVRQFEALGGKLNTVDVSSRSDSAESVPAQQSRLSTIGESIGAALSASFESVKNAGLDLLNVFNPLAIIGSIFHGALEAIAPTIESLRPAVEVVAKVFATALAPVLKALFPVFKLTAIAATYLGEILFRVAAVVADVIGFVVKGWGYIIRTIAEAVDKLPFVSARGAIDFAQGIINLGTGIQGIADGFREGADALAEGRDEIRAIEWTETAEGVAGLGAAALGATAALSSVPEIFDLALRRRQAALGGAAAPPVGGGLTPATVTPTDLGGNQPGITVNIVNPPAGMDARATARQFVEALKNPEVIYGIRRATGTI